VRLPGVGPALAARIVAARPFAEVDDLRRVRGLRTVLLERLRPLVVAPP
jgi:competence protein ComEA